MHLDLSVGKQVSDHEKAQSAEMTTCVKTLM